MKIAILYATREGQTRKIAEHVAATLRAHDVETDVLDVRTAKGGVTLDGYAGAILAASVHVGHHEKEMVSFVRAHKAALEAIPCAFLSVSLAEAGAELPTTPEALRAQAVVDVRKVIDVFFQETGWTPARVEPVAGALAFTKYNVLTRLLLKWIAKKRSGLNPDTKHDHEYTDWEALDRFAGAYLELLSAAR